MDITFATWLVIANVWIAVSHAVEDSTRKLICNLIGLLWLIMAIVYGILT